MKNKNAKRIAANRAIISKYEELYKKKNLGFFSYWVNTTDQTQYFKSTISEFARLNIWREAFGLQPIKEETT